ncbi:MAG: SDR family NAD(P)-dependent oxidoreductase [Lachnospiraceae bacterium]|nr:SDR family NAD(P)-dependent oxidoreductase [Lachnospiraceae bacterium]
MDKVIITGASRGIGRETALALARKGYGLYLVSSRSGEELSELKEKIAGEYGVFCETLLLDVADPSAVEEAFSGILGKDTVYALINNAGVASYELMTDMSVEAWKRMIDVNLNACFYTSRMVVPQMVRNRRGRIINVSSVWGSAGASMETAYSAAKGGLNAFTKALGKELAPSNVQVNAVSFGYIDTKMNAHLSKEEAEELSREIPMDRPGTAKEAAMMIEKILEAPDYLTAQVITMDGGWI